MATTEDVDDGGDRLAAAVVALLRGTLQRGTPAPADEREAASA